MSLYPSKEYSFITFSFPFYPFLFVWFSFSLTIEAFLDLCLSIFFSYLFWKRKRIWLAFIFYFLLFDYLKFAKKNSCTVVIQKKKVFVTLGLLVLEDLHMWSSLLVSWPVSGINYLILFGGSDCLCSIIGFCTRTSSLNQLLLIVELILFP